MRNATKYLTLALVLLWAAPVSAQTKRNVTFNVDLKPFVQSCQITPTTVVSLPGTIATPNWSAGLTKLTDADKDGIYTTTLELNQDTTYTFKVHLEGISGGWEGDPNRTYKVTSAAAQTVTINDVRLTPTNQCNAQKKNYSILFAIDMETAKLQGRFNPANKDSIVVAGNFQSKIKGGKQADWTPAAAVPLKPESDNPNVYTALIELDSLVVPQNLLYKFVIRAGQSQTANWESVDNRVLALTGNEPDLDNDRRADVIATGDISKNAYFNNVTPNLLLTEPVTFTIEVDMRPAYYHLADSTNLPSDTQSGDVTRAINFVQLFGPLAQSAFNGDPWPWGAEIPARKLNDAGTGGDRVAGDSVFTIQLTVPAGQARLQVAKLGINALDNEAGVQGDHNLYLTPGMTPIRLVFGGTMVMGTNGTVLRYTDDRGPNQQSPGDYDPYILIDNTTNPPSIRVVRRGGLSDKMTQTAVDPVDGEIPGRIALQQNYPNPFNPTTTFEYTLSATQPVRVRVYDVMGRVVATLVDGVQPASTYRVTFDASSLASGMYIYQLETPNSVLSRKMMLIK